MTRGVTNGHCHKTVCMSVTIEMDREREKVIDRKGEKGDMGDREKE